MNESSTEPLPAENRFTGLRLAARCRAHLCRRHVQVLAMWVDQNLILSMYPDVNVFLQIFANPGEHDTKRMLLNMMTTSLYLGLPLLWSGMMAWAGVHVGRAVDAAMSPLKGPVVDAGRYGGAIGRAVLTKGMARR